MTHINPPGIPENASGKTAPRAESGETVDDVFDRDRTSDRVEATATIPDLSVVIVTYNEADRIEDCLESVFAACSGLVSYEVILVDSNSTDETVELAREYPITILQIQDDSVTTPSAGRFVGTRTAQAEKILFVDGDMVIQRDWLADALACLRAHPEIVGVDGELNERAQTESCRPVDAVRGVALYERSALSAVDGFDPFLQSMEDIHLGFKLTTAGYQLRRLPSVAGEHPTREGVTEPVRRWRRGYMTGTGQAVRKSASHYRLLGKHLHRLRYLLGLIVWLVVGVGSLLLPGGWIVWLVLSVIAFGIVASKRGTRGAVRFFFGKIVAIPGFLRGLRQPPRSAEAFPLEVVDTIKHGCVHW